MSDRVAALEAAVNDADLPGVLAWWFEFGRDVGAVEEATAWLNGSWRAIRRAHRDHSDEPDEATRTRHYSDDVRIMAELAVRLLGPATAVKAIDWSGLWMHDRDGWTAPWRDAVNARGAAWRAAFVAALTSIRMGKSDLDWNAVAMYQMVAPLVVEHDFAMPDAPFFVSGWIVSQGAIVGEEEKIEAWRRDPLMPDILHRAIASGVPSYLSDTLPAAVRTLADEGHLDRSRLVSEGFDLLTSIHRRACGCERVVK